MFNITNLSYGSGAFLIDPAQFALFGFPGTVPEFAVHPGDARNKTVRLDGAKYRAGLRIDLMDLALAMLRDPERAFRPGRNGAPSRGTHRGLDKPHATGYTSNVGAKGFRPDAGTWSCAPRLSGGLVKHLAKLKMPNRHTQWRLN